MTLDPYLSYNSIISIKKLTTIENDIPQSNTLIN